MKVHDRAATLGDSVDGMDVTVQAVCCVSTFSNPTAAFETPHKQNKNM